MNNSVTVDGLAGTIQADGMVRFGSDDTVNVLFYTKSVLDAAQSRERGRPYHVSMPYVRIQQPGEKDYIDRPVAEYDQAKARWPHHWARFENGQQPAPAGTPLEVLFPMNPEIPANLHTLSVHTVEQLATLTANGAQTIGMGATEWQRKARAFLASANGGVGMHRLQQENEKLQSKLETQANQISLMQTQIERLTASTKQGIPSAMIPNSDPTLAQEYSAAIPVPKIWTPPALMSFPNDDLPDPAAGFDEGDAQGSGEAMFTEDLGDLETPAAEPDPAPKRRGGWPAGKPRPPRS